MKLYLIIGLFLWGLTLFSLFTNCSSQLEPQSLQSLNTIEQPRSLTPAKNEVCENGWSVGKNDDGTNICSQFKLRQDCDEHNIEILIPEHSEIAICTSEFRSINHSTCYPGQIVKSTQQGCTPYKKFQESECVVGYHPYMSEGQISCLTGEQIYELLIQNCHQSGRSDCPIDVDSIKWANKLYKCPQSNQAYSCLDECDGQIQNEPYCLYQGNVIGTPVCLPTHKTPCEPLD